MYLTHISQGSFVLKTDKPLLIPEKNAYWKCLIIHTIPTNIYLVTVGGRMAALSTRFLCVTTGLWRILMRKFQPTALPV